MRLRRASTREPPASVMGVGRWLDQPLRLRILATLAAVLGMIQALVWSMSFLRPSPVATWWPPLVLPAFVAALPLIGATIAVWLSRGALRTGRDLWRIVLPGWRAVVAGVLLVLTVGAFFHAFLFVHGGQAEVIDGRYYDNQHGERTEITRDRWLQLRSSESRTFAGGAMYFCIIAALGLRPRRDEQEAPSAEMSASDQDGTALS